MRLPLRIVRRIGWGLGVGISLLGVAEVLGRSTLGPPPPAVPLYSVVKPSDRFLRHEAEVLVPDFQLEPPDATIPKTTVRPRLVVVGGSSVHFGDARVPPAREFPQLLETELGIDVFNLGSPGLDTHDHARLVDELVEYPWSAILLYAGHNDFGNAYFLKRYSGARDKSRAVVENLLQHSLVFSLLRRGLTPSAGGGSLRLSDNRRNAVLSVAQRQDIQAALLRNVGRMAWASRRADIPLFVVVPAVGWFSPPIRGECNELGCPAKWFRAAESRRPNAAPGESARAFRDAGDADGALLHLPSSTQSALRESRFGGVTVLDAEVGLPREAGVDLPAGSLFVDAVHFSIAGHAAMADWLERELRASGRLDLPSESSVED